jgi:hypothetical protein
MCLACLVASYQLNAAGGEIWFHPKHMTLCTVDSETGEALLRNMDGLPSASSQTETGHQHRGVQEEAHAGIWSAATVAKKRPISSDLLHHCLGH